MNYIEITLASTSENSKSKVHKAILWELNKNIVIQQFWYTVELILEAKLLSRLYQAYNYQTLSYKKTKIKMKIKDIFMTMKYKKSPFHSLGVRKSSNFFVITGAIHWLHASTCLQDKKYRHPTIYSTILNQNTNEFE